MDGGDKNGGGNGLGALFANRASPVSNRNGGVDLRNTFGSDSEIDVENGTSGCHLG